MNKHYYRVRLEELLDLDGIHALIGGTVSADDFERVEPAPLREDVGEALEAVGEELRWAVCCPLHNEHHSDECREGGGERIRDARAALVKLRAALASPPDWQQQKDALYDERNRLVAALSKVFPSALEPDPEEPEEWRWFVRIDLPTGQATWHVHESSLSLFRHLERSGERTWDGHSTEEKYKRVDALEPGLVVVGHPEDIEVTEEHKRRAEAMRPFVLAGDIDGLREAARKAASPPPANMLVDRELARDAAATIDELRQDCEHLIEMEAIERAKATAQSLRALLAEPKGGSDE